MAGDREYMKLYMREYSAKRRAKVIELLGGVCAACGSPDKLDAHHIDPAEKSFTMGSRWHRKWGDILAELPKLQLLCETCHHARHGSQYRCGTPQRYWRGCRCPDCTRANSDYSREYKTTRL